MDSNIKQSVSNLLNISLQSIPEYNLFNFVEDSIQINNILNSEIRNPSDFKSCLNKLRAILRDNSPLFCSLFTNIIHKYLSLLKSENIMPEEYMFVLIDIVHNKNKIEKYFKKWIERIICALSKYFSDNMNSKDNEQLSKICSYIEYWFEEFISIDDNSINYLIFLFENIDIEIQKMSAFLFFKYIYRYDINKIHIIDWKLFFDVCVKVLEDNTNYDENKNVVQDIFKQILIYFNKLNVDPNDVLEKAESLDASKYFQNITGFNTDKAKKALRKKEII